MWIWLILTALVVLWLYNKGKAKAQARQPSLAPERYARFDERELTSAPMRSSGATSSRRQADACWLPAGETITIQGHVIDGGMIYVGTSLYTRWGAIENGLINPKLKVSGPPDTLGSTMSYWPSYSQIQPAARQAYLEWLASGRSDPDAYIGYVFLFFYGLERRLFHDGAADEARILSDEVRRLLSIYGENRSFDGYARRFLDAASVFLEPDPICTPSLEYCGSYEIPLKVRMYLGAKLRGGQALSADDCLIWVLSQPFSSPRTPIVRCFEEIRALWGVRFAERYGDGIKVRAPRTQVKFSYRPASATFEAELDVPEAPDIGSVQAGLDKLMELLASCTEDLSAYSRLIGRRPEARNSVEGSLLLPRELANSAAAAPVARLRGDFEARFAGDDLRVVPFGEIVSLLGLGQGEEKMTPTTARQVGVLLDRLDIGIEPDRRYGPITPGLESKVIIFKALNGAPTDPEQADFVAARTLVEIAVLAAIADGVVVPVEIASISADLEAIDGLSAQDRRRLLAFAMALMEDPPGQQAAMNRLAKLPARERTRITKSAIAAILADGTVTPTEVKYLERLHKVLGLPAADAYAALHRGSVQFDEPTPVAPAEWSPGSPVPAEPQKTIIAFDEKKLERVRQETSEVSKLLSEVFVTEEEVTVAKPTPVAPTEAPAFKGLDAAHASLLTQMLANGACDRAAFEQIARDLRLFADGALETINDWAYDNFDEAVLEGDEMIVASESLRERLVGMGGAA